MKKVLILANNDIGLYKFRKELIIELLKENKVFISLPYGENVDELVSFGCVYLKTNIDRRGVNPIKDFKLLLAYRMLIKDLKPDVVLTYTIKPNVYGGMICRFLKTPYLVNVTGLGTAIENNGILSKITKKLYKISLKKAACVFFQNESNKNFFKEQKIYSGNQVLLPGSGVNVEHYKYLEYPMNSVIHFLFIGRIMKAKGFDEIIEAIEILEKNKIKYVFDIVGFCEENYNEALKKLSSYESVSFHGLQKNVIPFIKECDAIVLPSYHEGMSNVLLEAASSGRGIITTNISGCKEIVIENRSGYCVEKQSGIALYNALLKYSKMPLNERESFGLNSRQHVEEYFDREKVIDLYMKEIRRLEM